MSSWSRSRTVFRGALRDLHSCSHPEVFIMIKKIEKRQQVLCDDYSISCDNCSILCDDCSIFSNVAFETINFTFLCHSFYYYCNFLLQGQFVVLFLFRYIDSQNADGSYTYGFEVTFESVSL